LVLGLFGVWGVALFTLGRDLTVKGFPLGKGVLSRWAGELRGVDPGCLLKGVAYLS